VFHHPRGTFLITGFLFASLLAGCRQEAPAPQEQVFSKIDPVNSGTVTGTIHFKDISTPAQVPIDMSQDPACGLSGAPPNMSEQYIIHHGDLQNAYIYIQSGLGAKIYAPATTPVVLDQIGCRYVPHVIAVMVDQPIEIHNSDMTMHNVHPEPIAVGNHESDITQGPHGKPDIVKFSQPEQMLPVRCNNHPWMQAFINVADNPFFAISDADGHYVIHGLPPGTYQLGAVHEKLGRKDMTITVTDHGTTTADFTFTAR
jgi:hypothetical protein